MKSLLILIISLLIYTTSINVVSAENVNGFSELYHMTLEKADLKNNFLTAPKEIEQILLTLMKPTDETSEDDLEQVEINEIHTNNFPEIPELQVQPFNPIITTNTLFSSTTRAENTEYISEKLTNANIDFNTNTEVINKRKNSLNTPVDFINSVTMKARWAFNFQKRDTQKHIFHNSANNHHYVDSMRKDGIFSYAVLEDLNATALELSTQESDLKMLIVLPNETDGLDALEQELSDLSEIEKIISTKFRSTLLRVFMPKFKISHRIALKDYLSESADSKLSNVMHNAEIEVSEDGLGNLEQRTVLFWNAYSSLRTTPKIFDMDHPFLFVLHNAEGIQFVGHLAKM